MCRIKTRKAEDKIKARSGETLQQLEKAYIRTKNNVGHGTDTEESSPSDYASDRFCAGMENLGHEGFYQLDEQGRRGVRITQENLAKVKEKVQKRKAVLEQPKKQAEKQAARQVEQQLHKSIGRVELATVPKFPTTLNQEGSRINRVKQGDKRIKAVNRSKRAANQASEAAARRAVKTADKTIKTAEKTGKSGIKTVQQAAQTSSHAVQAAKHTVYYARTAAIRTAQTAKKAFKAATSAIKSIIAAAKALTAALIAGGWIAVMMIVIICLVGLIVGSGFGIFVSGEDSGTGQTMQTAVQEINAEYQEKLDEIKASYAYDVLEMHGSQAVWPEVLAVYAVKTTTDTANSQDVATMDDEKQELLKDIFWEMNQISSSTATQTETVIITSDDGNGNIVESEVTVTRTYLYITITHKTADEMAAQFGFDDDQREQMEELLADENSSLWSQVLYGYTAGGGDIVAAALSQVGNQGGDLYWSWYGFDNWVDWCACFVSWCADQSGYIEAGVIPKFSACASQGIPWFQERGLWRDNSYEPKAGDLIFFDWDKEGEGQDGVADHVGIVEKVENGRVYTIEGNSGNAVRQNSYLIGDYEIIGYAAPAY